MKAHVNGETEISSIVHMLGKLIRRNLEIGAGKIRLKDELEIVRCYLEIRSFATAMTASPLIWSWTRVRSHSVNPAPDHSAVDRKCGHSWLGKHR